MRKSILSLDNVGILYWKHGFNNSHSSSEGTWIPKGMRISVTKHGNVDNFNFHPIP